MMNNKADIGALQMLSKPLVLRLMVALEASDDVPLKVVIRLLLQRHISVEDAKEHNKRGLK